MWLYIFFVRMQALKVDLANSLQHRLSVLIEDEIDVNGAFNLPMMPFFAWGLPRRVFLNIGDMYGTTTLHYRHDCKIAFDDHNCIYVRMCAS